MSTRIKVANLHQVRTGSPLVVEVGDCKIALSNVGGVIRAYENACPHVGAPLSEGVIIGDEIICPLHHWSFHVETGVCTSNPLAPKPLRIFPVVIENDAVWLEM
jgi:nitrite reductase (NADH) small subunit